ncbi:MAG TPA: FHA domain-containing protein [Burkholderiaceae bacterium]|nr:FHA domain-containing protein [Burkholderiaceae bacterium]
MAKLIVTLDDNLINVVSIDKNRMTLGRRPYNDVMVDNLAVSGEHAAIQAIGSEFYVEDLNSTNGTYINGKKVKRQILQTGDQIELGKYILKYINEATETKDAASHSNGQNIDTNVQDSSVEDTLYQFEKTRFAEVYVAVKVVSGPAIGKEIPLVKVVTTIGKPGEAVIAITKRPKNYVVAHVEGVMQPTLNGVPFGIDAVTLKNGDLFELAGTAMEFIEAS